MTTDQEDEKIGHLLCFLLHFPGTTLSAMAVGMVDRLIFLKRIFLLSEWHVPAFTSQLFPDYNFKLQVPVRD